MSPSPTTVLRTVWLSAPPRRTRSCVVAGVHGAISAQRPRSSREARSPCRFSRNDTAIRLYGLCSIAPGAVEKPPTTVTGHALAKYQRPSWSYPERKRMKARLFRGSIRIKSISQGTPGWSTGGVPPDTMPPPGQPGLFARPLPPGGRDGFIAKILES